MIDFFGTESLRIGTGKVRSGLPNVKDLSDLVPLITDGL